MIKVSVEQDYLARIAALEEELRRMMFDTRNLLSGMWWRSVKSARSSWSWLPAP
ncbi:hypothetical protein EF68_004304 [Salmonella enterica subsp. enterica]|nr:hypothetical protein [Salmonella enterica subsp. enterica]EDT2972302.1 hypothetical protein [Salmonella enterica subsp. enterica serovar Fischerstrasse]EEF7978010.1 hypothetical protein [Salmonella enterica]EGF4902714.1 hypothetical protein [Salmonella enterica subsp. enterica serovar Bredeney]EHC1065936.1 hypothetical protein [Salmonella enterica subsp. enterica serovar Chomedey]EHP7187595.1 hypothetical protein [Salmonella enterica subsp. enterica serovar Thompson]